MMTPDFRVRFVGRFVFACEGQVTHPSRIDALAMNMGYNADLHSDSHHTLLTIQRRHVSPRVSSFANHSAYAPSVAPDVNAELFVWDVSESDIDFHGHGGDAFSFEKWDEVPDLGTLSGGGRLDKDFVHEPLGTRSPVAARFRLPAGLVRAVQFEDDKRVRFDPLEEEEAQGDADAKLPDAIELDLASERMTPLTITLTSHRDGRRRSIVVAAPAVEGKGREPVVISITNLCAARAPVTNDDREFAAYYDVMTEPRHPRHRLVPFRATAPSEGGRADCTGVAKAAF